MKLKLIAYYNVESISLSSQYFSLNIPYNMHFLCQYVPIPIVKIYDDNNIIINSSNNKQKIKRLGIYVLI